MKKYRNETGMAIGIGIDLGDRYSHFAVMRKDGEVIEEGRIKTSEVACARLSERYPSAEIAMEVGTHSRWVSRYLSNRGHDVIVANARKLRLIYESDHKDDRLDALMLAKLLLSDIGLLSPVEHRSEEMQQDLGSITARQLVVKARTQLINYIRMTAKSAGQQLPKGVSTAAFHRIEREGILKQASVEPLLDQIGQLSQHIKIYDRQIVRLCKEKYPETEDLQQIKGVGPLIALCFVLTLQSADRFASSRQVGAYLGLCQRRSQSGDRDPQLRITKAGNRLMRSLLIQGAHYITGPFGEDSDLRRHGEKIAARGGANAKKRALVAVARKLSVLMHHLWATGELYEPLYNADRSQAA